MFINIYMHRLFIEFTCCLEVVFRLSRYCSIVYISGAVIFFLAILHAGPNQGLSKILLLYGCLDCFSDLDAACMKMPAMPSVMPFIDSAVISGSICWS